MFRKAAIGIVLNVFVGMTPSLVGQVPCTVRAELKFFVSADSPMPDVVRRCLCAEHVRQLGAKALSKWR